MISPENYGGECQFSAGLSVLGQSVGAGGGFSSEVAGTGRPAERGNGMVGGVLVAQDALDDFGVLN